MARDYVVQPETPWRYFSDQVMGGVSSGRAEARGGVITLSGQVSTANRGGFIQVRTELATPLAPDIVGIALEARGNGQRYFIHVRTKGTKLPWQYYQASFDAGPAWQETRLAFTEFQPSGALLRATPRPQDIVSVGLVAYGRDHEAQVSIRSLSTFS